MINITMINITVINITMINITVINITMINENWELGRYLALRCLAELWMEGARMRCAPTESL
jgi:hypothetical protein